MARRRRGGFGGIVALLAGAWVLSLFVGDKDDPARVYPAPTTIAATQKQAVEPDRSGQVTQQHATQETPDAIHDVAPAPRWIRGSKVAFRAGPATSFTILDRFNTGREVALLQVQGDWSKVRDELTLRDGWIASRFLVDQAPPARKPAVEKREPVQKPVVVPRVEISDAEIVDRIIAQSIANYSGNCPCPFNTDRAGRRCGKRSAYSRPGGASPICYISDVTPDMISAFRQR